MGKQTNEPDKSFYCQKLMKSEFSLILKFFLRICSNFILILISLASLSLLFAGRCFIYLSLVINKLQLLLKVQRRIL